MRRLDFCLRFFGTALGFVSFGLGGLLFALLIVPPIWIGNRDRLVRSKTLRRQISRSFRLHVNMLRLFGVLDYRLHHPQRLQPGQLIIANHPTLLDVVFLVGFIENAVCVVKDSLFHNFWLGVVIRMANYISNKDPESLITASIGALDRGESVIIFPEGTRSVPGQASQLQRGAAYVALRAQRDLTPIHISCVPSSLTKAEPWYQIPPAKMQFDFVVGNNIVVLSQTEQQRGRAARAVNQQIRLALFNQVTLETSHVGS